MARSARPSPLFSAWIVLPVVLVACGGSVAPDGTSGGSTAPSGTTPGSGSSSSSGSSASAATCGAAVGETPVCAASVTIASEADLSLQIAGLGWPFVSGDRPARLESTSDLFFLATLEVDASAMPTGLTCGPTPCPPLFIIAATTPTGVHCIVPGESSWGRTTCARVRIDAGTTLRVRTSSEDHHPMGSLPAMELLPSCATPCAPSEQRCASTQQCLPLGRSFCLYCELLDGSVCACRTDGCGLRADGDECSYSTSPDTISDGICSGGTCSSRR
jgi:hypothetical protein